MAASRCGRGWRGGEAGARGLRVSGEAWHVAGGEVREASREPSRHGVRERRSPCLPSAESVWKTEGDRRPLARDAQDPPHAGPRLSSCRLTPPPLINACAAARDASAACRECPGSPTVPQCAAALGKPPANVWRPPSPVTLPPLGLSGSDRFPWGTLGHQTRGPPGHRRGAHRSPWGASRQLATARGHTSSKEASMLCLAQAQPDQTREGGLENGNQ
jgi:hypothetical protein